MLFAKLAMRMVSQILDHAFLVIDVLAAVVVLCSGIIGIIIVSKKG